MVGFAVPEEQYIDGEPTGVFVDKVVERPYYGDVTRNSRRLSNGESINDNITISNSISIVADPFAKENCAHISYVMYMGARWKATTADIQPPRIVLTLGGVYNGPTP